jgi:hypothetical protein
MGCKANNNNDNNNNNNNLCSAAACILSLKITMEGLLSRRKMISLINTQHVSALVGDH